MKILIIEDDPNLNANIKTALESEAYVVETAFDGQIGLRLLKKEKYDCIVLDINLPYINGFEITKQFRNFNQGTPIIMLTAFGELEDKVKGYSIGADDYLTKPFYMKELILRINALLKRGKSSTAKDQNHLLIVDDIVLNKKKKSVHRNTQEIQLTQREYQILELLMDFNGEVVSKQKLLTKIWNTSQHANTNAIEVYINFLRNKVDKPFGKKNIKTKIGYGYFIASDNED